MKSKNAFTLVELLVVIAIVSVLAAILLPSLQSALTEARRVDCANRMRQQMILAAEYEGMFRCPLSGFITQKPKSNQDHGFTYVFMLHQAGLIDESVNIPMSYPVRYVNHVLRPKLTHLCPSGYVRGYTSRDINDISNQLALGNRDDLNLLNQDAINTLDASIPRYYSKNGTLAHYNFPFSYAINCGEGRFNTNLSTGFTQSHSNYPFGSDYRPIKHIPQSPSSKLFHIEGRYWGIGMSMFRESDKVFGVRVAHGDLANITFYDGHAGVVTRDQLQLAGGGDTAADRARVLSVTKDLFEW